MATDRKLKADLLSRLGVTSQRLSQLIGKRKAELPMSTELATYTIAHEHGMDISRYLDQETTREVRGLVADLGIGRGQNGGGDPRPQRKKPTSPRRKAVKIKFAGLDIGKIPALKESHAADAKRMSERVYPTLYIFENSVRDLIELVLKDAFGKDWWVSAVPASVQETARDHRESQKKDPWHGPRGRREIDYVFLSELWKIIKHQWSHFRALFPDQAWVQTIITRDMNVSRRVLAHMNPLGADDVRNIEAAFSKWAKQLRAVEGNLP